MAKKRAVKKRAAKKRPVKRRTKNIFSIAASNKSYKAAKAALKKVEMRAKKAYKKALAAARKKIKSK
jgi:hypothetical protein